MTYKISVEVRKGRNEEPIEGQSFCNLNTEQSSQIISDMMFQECEEKNQFIRQLPKKY